MILNSKHTLLVLPPAVRPRFFLALSLAASSVPAGMHDDERGSVQHLTCKLKLLLPKQCLSAGSAWLTGG